VRLPPYKLKIKTTRLLHCHATHNVPFSINELRDHTITVLLHDNLKDNPLYGVCLLDHLKIMFMAIHKIAPMYFLLWARVDIKSKICNHISSQSSFGYTSIDHPQPTDTLIAWYHRQDVQPWPARFPCKPLRKDGRH
jgi:hypothetical protein